MVFSSVIFLCIFLPVMLLGYYLLPKKARNAYLLLGSLFFYAWSEPKYIFIMFASIVGNYLFGLLIARFSDTEGNDTYQISNLLCTSSHKASQRIVLLLSVLYNLGILFYFKYFVLICTTIHDLINSSVTIPEILLPIGISFYTFQGMSYVIDVYRMENAALPDGTRQSIVQRNPISLALYIAMFPQLIAGPIVRYTDIKNDINKRRVTTSDFTQGLERFIVGLAKKALLANTIGEIADSIFSSDVSMLATSVAWLGAICYTIQIYYDFSGYSDMAIGLGRMFGFRFLENFNYPYISRSITEFWRRWHMSLSGWFRDYLYIPLGGNRRGNVYVNLLIVFLATGIWHGAAWGFLVWGLWHGLFMLLERVLKAKGIRVKLPTAVKWLYTMLVVLLGWVLFKLEDIRLAFSYFGVMFHTQTHAYNAFDLGYYLDGKLVFFLIVAVLAAIPWAQVLPRYPATFIARFNTSMEGASFIIRRALLIILLLLSMMFIMNSSYNPFIYFRF